MNERRYVGVGLKHNGEYILITFDLPEEYENNLSEAQWYFLWHKCPSFCEDSIAIRFQDFVNHIKGEINERGTGLQNS